MGTFLAKPAIPRDLKWASTLSDFSYLSELLQDHTVLFGPNLNYQSPKERGFTLKKLLISSYRRHHGGGDKMLRHSLTIL